ncbi:MAG: hypothetical protein RIS92_406 [Verrucomicrobiota bacterium]
MRGGGELGGGEAVPPILFFPLRTGVRGGVGLRALSSAGFFQMFDGGYSKRVGVTGVGCGSGG